jgi:two-component system, LytTR family, response regulator
MLKLNFSKHYIIILFSVIALGLFLYNLFHDAVESKLKGYDYFFSESMLFSMIWLIFIPFSYLIYKRSWYSLALMRLTLIIISISLGHLLINAALIWLISFGFFNHTFFILGNFKFGFLEYFLLLNFLYSILIICLRYINLKQLHHSQSKTYASSFVFKTNGTQEVVSVGEIIYLIAQTPYIQVVTAKKKYLEQTTLKQFTGQLNPSHFVRIHKSTVINLQWIQSYTSRMNGDYDILMKNGEELRLSRNYYNDFKNKLT